MSGRTKQVTTVDGEEVPFCVVRSNVRQKTIALQVRPDGRIVVRAPIRTSNARVEGILIRKKAWISVHRGMALANAVPTRSNKEFVAGETFSLLGQQKRLTFVIKEGHPAVSTLGRSIVILRPAKRTQTRQEIRNALSEFFRCEAAVIFRLRLQRFLAKLGLKEAPRLYIADQTRRWGSCNGRGELRLNWRLIGAPISLIDYVIVHELCHLLWSDHSSRFWRELRRVMPDYRIREQSLCDLGPSLVF